ncbi:MAG: alcohol dehydrogenase, partial [Saprospiraceae bacterium]|nr:alcohol dehydrogenase [Saprospiraceae bacterium]
MKALIIKQLNSLLEFSEAADPTAGKNEAIVSLRAAALNHRDLFITQGLYAGIKTPCVLGSDGAGEWRGNRVLLYPALEWGNNPNFQGKNFRVLGMP